MGKNGTYHYFRNYVVDENYHVPEPYLNQVLSIIEYLQTRTELRYVAAKRLGVSENVLILMINFYNNHKTDSVKVPHD